MQKQKEGGRTVTIDTSKGKKDMDILHIIRRITASIDNSITKRNQRK